MRFDEFIKNVEVVINECDGISFARPGWNNGASFGVIEKSNFDGIFIAAQEHFIGDGDTALSHIKLYKSIIEAFDYIWKMNCFRYELGSYKDYDFQFDKVNGLIVDNCYRVLKK